MSVINTNTRPIALRLIALGVPIIVGQIGTILQSFADTIMVGQYGVLELSASGFVGNVFNLVIFFMLGVSYSTTPIVGSLFGRGDKRGMYRVLSESLILGLLMSLVVVALLVLMYCNLGLFRQPEELLPLIRPYFICQLLSIPFMAVFNSLKQYSDAIGQTRRPMWVMITANAVNILLNALLIFGLFGCPRLGLLGAGIATLTARIFMAAVMSVAIAYSLKKEQKRDTALSGISPTTVVPTRTGIHHLLIVGLPIAFQLCLEASSFNLCAIFMGWIGTAPLAAHQVMCSISTVSFQLLYGIGAAAAIMVSQYRGQNDNVMIRRTVGTAYSMGLCLTLTMVVTLLFTSDRIISIFTSDTEVYQVLQTIFPLFLIYQFGDCTQIIFANVLRGLEQVKRMTLYAFIAYIMVSLPVSYTMAFIVGMDSRGVWCGMPVGLTVAGLLFWQEYRKVMRNRTI